MLTIETDSLAKSFGATKAVDRVSLGVPEGSIYGFIGPNGAGKTTTLRLLTGLARADSGSIRIHGLPAGFGHTEYRRLVGYLPDEPAFFTWMTALEYVYYSARLFGRKGTLAKSQCREVLEKVGLSGTGRKRIGTFSRGMKKRLGIAQALVNEPAVMFLDEPTSALDPEGREAVLSILADLRGKATVFMSTHILDDVERVCDHVGFINRGKLVYQGKLGELRCGPLPNVVRVILGAPSDRFVAGLSKRTWVDRVNRDGECLNIQVSDLETAQREIPALVHELGELLVRFEILQPDLEEVFLTVIGKPRNGNRAATQ